MHVNTFLFLMTTLGSIFSALSKTIVKHGLAIFFQETERAKSVREDIANVRTEMSRISMMDEFAKYARLQRKLIKMQDELKAEKMSVNSSRFKFRVMISSVVTVVTRFLMLFMLYMYRSEPVLILPVQWMSPFSSLISWPSQETGAVSVFLWIAICGSVSRLVTTKLS